MPNKGKKLAVLECLRSADAAQSLPELLALLPPDFAERSVRRWLGELADEGAVFRSGRKRGTRYRAAPPFASGHAHPARAGAAPVPAPATVPFSPTAEAAIAYLRPDESERMASAPAGAGTAFIS